VYSSRVQNCKLCALGRSVLLSIPAVSSCTVNIILFTALLEPIFIKKTQILNSTTKLRLDKSAQITHSNSFRPQSKIIVSAAHIFTQLTATRYQISPRITELYDATSLSRRIVCNMTRSFTQFLINWD
jgi:hypothetical protein